MTFSCSSTPEFDFLTSFSCHLNAQTSNGLLEIPQKFGQGFIKRLALSQNIKLTIHHYILKEELVIDRISPEPGSGLISVFFYSNETPMSVVYNHQAPVTFSQGEDSAVQVASSDQSSTVRFPAHEKIHYLVIEITPARLRELLAIEGENPAIQTIIEEGSSFLFLERMAAETRLLLNNMTAVDLRDTLSTFYMQIKVQELLYQVFYRLSLRQNRGQQIINSADAQRLMYIRSEIIRDLGNPPVLRELSRLGAMSETKLKKLFKQTFGTTIYNYFQQARMKKAAFLLKKEKRSVAQVGYEMGFSNLSHFSRLFEKHYGQNPKRFSSS